MEVALISNLKELDFWEMTIAEVHRHIEANEKVRRIEAQEKASHNYILASLITRGFCISMGSKESFPSLDEVYPELFSDIKAAQEEKIQQRKLELSALRFKQFAQSYNSRINKEVLAEND